MAIVLVDGGSGKWGAQDVHWTAALLGAAAANCILCRSGMIITHLILKRDTMSQRTPPPLPILVQFWTNMNIYLTDRITRPAISTDATTTLGPRQWGCGSDMFDIVLNVHFGASLNDVYWHSWLKLNNIDRWEMGKFRDVKLVYLSIKEALNYRPISTYPMNKTLIMPKCLIMTSNLFKMIQRSRPIRIGRTLAPVSLYIIQGVNKGCHRFCFWFAPFPESARVEP